jgi:hypothetical protein
MSTTTNPRTVDLLAEIRKTDLQNKRVQCHGGSRLKISKSRMREVNGIVRRRKVDERKENGTNKEIEERK